MTIAMNAAATMPSAQGTMGTAAGGQNAVTTARQAKLAEAAQKFEGMMLEELLKPMQKAGSVSGGGFGADEDADDDGTDKSMDTFDSYGVEAMAEALAKGGGLGLAKQVLRQIGNLDERGREKS